MDCCHYITDLPERKSGQYLQREERGAIQALKRQGLSNRAIARELGCSPTTIGNELRRGTPPRKSSKGRTPGYSAKHGEAVYRSQSVPFPETAQTAFLRSIRILGCCPGQRAQVVSGCLRRLRKTPRTVSGQRDGLYPHALS